MNVSRQVSTQYTTTRPIDQKARCSLRYGILETAKVRDLLYLNVYYPRQYSDSSIVTAIQHWHLARILLSAFDPTTPRIGPNQKRAIAQKEVYNILVKIFGGSKNVSRLRLRRMSLSFVVLLAPTKQHLDSLLPAWACLFVSYLAFPLLTSE